MTYYSPVCPKCGSDGVKTKFTDTGMSKSCFNCNHSWSDPPLELVPLEPK